MRVNGLPALAPLVVGDRPDIFVSASVTSVVILLDNVVEKVSLGERAE